MKIAVEGCAHGELEVIYDTLENIQKQENFTIDLLICCGDFQASRNEGDLQSMAVPPKYSQLCTFYKYYTGEKVAPILTIFIGGNHEASNYLQELPYGGWVAPNIYYLGYAGVINIAGIRIAGLSGIYKAQDYLKGHFEVFPYTESTKRSVYHIRNIEVFRLKQLQEPVDIFLSHDWPQGIWNHGDVENLLRRKQFLRNDIESGQLGSKPCAELLDHLKPKFWFAAHLHCKFAALVHHSDDKTTKFLALDKCLPGRRFLQLIDILHDGSSEIELSYDLEWLGILHSTNHLMSIKPLMNFLPSDQTFLHSDEVKNLIDGNFGDLKVPTNFVKTAEGHGSNIPIEEEPSPNINPQTVEFCKKLCVDDPIQLITNYCVTSLCNEVPPCDSTEGLESQIENKKLINQMSLPTPQFDSYNDLSEEDVIVTEESTIKQSNVSSSSILETSENVENEVNCSSNSVKQFKRRNASLYS